MAIEPKWLEHARLHVGTKEFKGTQANPAVLEFFKAVGHDEIDDDATSWCAAFVGAMLKLSGYPLPPKATNLLARSYLKYGKVLDAPRVGCIVVFWRGNPSSWQGHVGFYISEDEKHIYCLGGNQGNAVNITKYTKDRVLGYRWPIAVDAKELEAAGSTEMKTVRKIKETAVVVGTGAATIEAAKETGVVDQMKEITGGLDAGKVLLEGINEVVTLLTSNGLILVAGISLGGYLLARWWAQKRLERHAAGHPLSVLGG